MWLLVDHTNGVYIDEQAFSFTVSCLALGARHSTVVPKLLSVYQMSKKKTLIMRESVTSCHAKGQQQIHLVYPYAKLSTIRNASKRPWRINRFRTAAMFLGKNYLELARVYLC